MSGSDFKIVDRKIVKALRHGSPYFFFKGDEDDHLSLVQVGNDRIPFGLLCKRMTIKPCTLKTLVDYLGRPPEHVFDRHTVVVSDPEILRQQIARTIRSFSGHQIRGQWILEENQITIGEHNYQRIKGGVIYRENSETKNHRVSIFYPTGDVDLVVEFQKVKVGLG